VEIVEKANETFNAQPELKALFLFDPDLNYREEIAKIEANNIEVLSVTEKEGIEAKYRIEKEGDEKKFLVYCPFLINDSDVKQQFHLFDLLQANKKLTLNPVDEFIEEYNLPQDLKELIGEFYKEGLRFKKDRKPLKPILNASLTEKKLKLGLVQRILGFSKVSPSPKLDETIAKLFSVATNKDLLKEKITELGELDLDAFLGKELSQFFELKGNNLDYQSIKTAAQKFKYNVLMGPINEVSEKDPYPKLQLKSSHIHNRLSSFIIDWRRNRNLDESPEDVIQQLAAEVSEEQLIEVYGADAHYGLPTKEIIIAVLKFSVPLVQNQPKKVLNTLSNYRDDLRDQNSSVANALQALWNMAVFYNELKNHPVKELDTAPEYIESYKNHYYEVDRRYRKSVTSFRQINDPWIISETGLDEAFDEFLRFYQSDFIHKLNIGWQQRLSEIKFNFSELGTKRQSEFYESFIASSDIKTAVIISDAFRYEAAEELFTVLKRDTKKVLDIEPMLASVPSHTGLGMASLLPIKDLSIDSGEYVAGDTKTGSTPNRKAILQDTDSDSTAITALEIQEMSQTERRELFKEYNTVYIYHNLIDTIGEQRNTEKKVFKAVDDTIEELDKLISKLNSANVYRFVITADHGFSYMENKLDDATMEDSPDVKGKVKGDPRFVVASEIPDDFEGYSFPISATSPVKDDYYVALPRAVNRFKHPGVRYHYVHGGASLQEVLVPVIEVNRKREDKGQKVDIKLISNNYKITTGSAQIEILQVQSVGDKRNPRKVKFGFYNDAKELVSDEQEVVFEATSSDATLRKKKILLTLTSAANDLNHCTLLGFDVEDELNPLINQRYIIKTIIEQDDF